MAEIARTEENSYWCVYKEVRKKQWIDKFKQFCWVCISFEEVTPHQDTQEEADKDFKNLGFDVNEDSYIQCHDDITEKVWTRYIVQHHSATHH